MYYIWAIIGRIWGLILIPLILIRGGTTERVGAALYAVAWGATYILQSRSGSGPGLSVLIIDGAMALAFVILSLRTRKLWTMLASACAINAVLFHIVGMLGKIDTAAYVTSITLWGGYGMLFSLTLGWIGHERAKSS